MGTNLSQCDQVTLHLALGPAADGLAGDDQLGRWPAGVEPHRAVIRTAFDYGARPSGPVAAHASRK